MRSLIAGCNETEQKNMYQNMYQIVDHFGKAVNISHCYYCFL